MEAMQEYGKRNSGADTYRKALKAAFPNTIPVLTGYGALGFAYGLLMASQGYGVLWSALMSIFGFAGSMQYAAVALLTTAFDPLQAFILSLLINARHLFYGLSMLTKYRGLGKKRSYLIFALTDETYSIVSSINPPENVDKGLFYFFISLLDHAYWVLATILGALVGGMITFNTMGLDFALSALFVVLFMEQMKKKENYIFGVIGIVGAFAARMISGADNMVIPAMVIILAALLGGRKKLCI